MRVVYWYGLLVKLFDRLVESIRMINGESIDGRIRFRIRYQVKGDQASFGKTIDDLLRIDTLNEQPVRYILCRKFNWFRMIGFDADFVLILIPFLDCFRTEFQKFDTELLQRA